MKARKKQTGGEQLQEQEVLQTSSVSEILQDFQVYNQHLREETYLVFQQLHASGELLASSSVSQYEEAFEDNSFSEVKQSFDTLMREIETDEHEFIINTVFTDANANANENGEENVLMGGGRLDFGIDLSNITTETVGSYSTKILLSIIERHQRNHGDLSLQQQQSLILCVTEYQVKAMTSLNTLYLGDIGVSCMLSGAIANMGELLKQYDATGGDLSQWMSSAVSLAKQSAAIGQQTVRGIATRIEQSAKTIAKAAHEDIAQMPLNKKMNILQNLFADVLKWGGKQVMLRLRAPEFDVASVSDMASFKQEILSFIGNRISQIMSKSEKFRGVQGLRKERLKWVLSVLENIESLLTFIKTLSQLSLPSGSPDFNVKLNVKASMSKGISVNIEPNEWLKEIGQSLDGLKSIIDERKNALDNILDINIRDMIRDGEHIRKTRDTERQLNLLNKHIEVKQSILSRQPDNNIIRAELGRLLTVRDKLLENNNKKSEDIEETCIQLLQEIHTYVSSMNIPSVPLDIMTRQIIREVALKVDHSAFTSVASNVMSEVSKIDIGMKAYFGCVGKYLEYCPNISNVCKHIGFAMPDLHNVIEKLGTVSGFVSNTVSSAGVYLQAVNMALLLIHLIVAASLSCRNNTLNKDRVSLTDIKRASQERLERMSLSKSVGGKGSGSRTKMRKGGTLPPLMYSQGQTLKMRRGLIDKSHEMPFFVQGRKSILNERVKKHSMYLLEPQFTKDQILRTLLTKSVNSSTQLGQSLIGNVSSYMYANEQSLDNTRSVLDNLKSQLPQLSSVRSSVPLSCTATPSVMTDEEDLYVLSIFAKYQGQQLRESFAFSGSSQKPSMESLYCSVSQRMYLEDERLKKIVASIVGNFNGGLLSGGRTIGKSRTSKKAIIGFLEKKTGKQLYAYATSKGIPVTSTMRKSKLIQMILDMV
jgi:hypothetical protein